MAKGTKDFSIGDHKYMITQFPATKATKVLIKLAHLVGESISLFAVGATDKAKMKEILPKALSSIIYRMDSDDTVTLVKELMECAVISGQGSQTAAQDFDNHFRGRIGDMLKLSVEVVNHNYENFFDVVASLLPSLPETTKTESK